MNQKDKEGFNASWICDQITYSLCLRKNTKEVFTFSPYLVVYNATEVVGESLFASS